MILKKVTLRFLTDLLLCTSQITAVDNFANSWVVNIRETCEAYIPMEPCDDGGGSPNLPEARSLCSLLRQRRGTFKIVFNSNCVYVRDI